jgi:hypothetical protein
MIIVRVIGAILFVGFIGCAISTSIVVSDMIEDINRVSAEKESPLFGYPGKIGRIKRKYRQLCPNGGRARLLNRLMIVATALFILGAGLMLLPASR